MTMSFLQWWFSAGAAVFVLVCMVHLRGRLLPYEVTPAFWAVYLMLTLLLWPEVLFDLRQSL